MALVVDWRAAQPKTERALSARHVLISSTNSKDDDGIRIQPERIHTHVCSRTAVELPFPSNRLNSKVHLEPCTGRKLLARSTDELDQLPSQIINTPREGSICQKLAHATDCILLS